MVLRKEITIQIKDLLKKNPQGLSITEIVGAIGVNRNTAGRYLENLLVSGQVEMRRFGMAKIYMLSQRVPLSAILSISSELVVQLDSNLRIIFTNEPFLDLIRTHGKEVLGKNIEYTSVATVFEEAFPWLIRKIRDGLNGNERSGDIALRLKGLIFFYRIAPTVFEDGRKGVSVILEDITEQRQADDKLRESEDRYRKLVEISPDAVFLHREGRILYANPAAFTLLGASHSDEIVGKNILDFVPPAFQDRVRTNIEKDLEGQTSPRTELTMLRIDGTSILVEGRGIGTIIDGKPAVLVAIRDITEQKQAEEALRESEATAHALLNAPTDSVILIDNRGIILALNETAALRFGKRSDELIGSLADDLLPEKVAKTRRTLITRVLEKKGMVRFEDNRDGRWYDTVAYPIFSESGEVDKIAIIARDISEQKRIRDSLKESEELLRLLLDSSDDLIFMQNPSGEYLYINAAAQYGISKKEILGSTPHDFIDRKTADMIVERIKRVVKNGKSIRDDTQIVWKGQTLWFSDNLFPVKDGTGNVTAVVTISQNITERKRNEKLLVESETRYRSLAEASQDLIFVIDRNDRVVYVNSFAASVLQKQPEDIIGKPRVTFFPSEITSRQWVQLQRVFENGKPVRSEGSMILKNNIHWFDHFLVPLSYENGCVQSVLGISRDITQQKIKDDDFRHSE